MFIRREPRGNRAGLRFDDGPQQITTFPRTFYRWVTTPGTHTIKSSEGNLSASLRLPVEAGQIYFVQHYVQGIRGSTTDANLEKINDKAGRELVRANRML